MLTLSPAAQAFWGAVIRHLLTGLAGVLVTHGYVSQTGATAYTEELVGLALQGAVMLWANRIVYWQQVRALIGRSMPAGTTHDAVVAKVDELTTAKTLPSVFTPSNVSASLVKPVVLFIVSLGLVSLPSCATTGLVPTTQGAHIAVVSVHGIIDAEDKAFHAGVIDLDHHQIYVAGLLKLVESEQVLNDALRAWNASAGQPMPTIVADAIFSLGVIVDDLKPLAGTSAAAPLLSTLSSTIALLKGSPR